MGYPTKSNNQLLEITSDFTRTLDTLLKDVPSQGGKINNEDYIKLNAYFIYAFTVFDRFIGDLIKISIKRKGKMRDKYLKIFTSLAKQKIREDNKEQKQYGGWERFFNKPTLMIKNYQILEKERNQIVLIKQLFDFDVKDKAIKTSWNYYLEARERRNLLAHRGYAPDNIYYRGINKYVKDKKFIQQIFERGGLYSNSSEWEDSKKEYVLKENNPEKPINISITPDYFHFIIDDLIFISTIFLIYCYGNSSLKNESPLNHLHDILVFAFTNEKIFTYIKCWELYIYYAKNCKNNMLLNLDIQDKVNYLLTVDYIANYTKDKTWKEIHNNISPGLIQSILEDDFPDKDIIHYLMVAHYKNDVDLFVDATEKFIKKDEINISFVKNWLIFKKFYKKKKFKKILDEKK